MTKNRKRKKKKKGSYIMVIPTHYDMKDNFKSFNEIYGTNFKIEE